MHARPHLLEHALWPALCHDPLSTAAAKPPQEGSADSLQLERHTAEEEKADFIAQRLGWVVGDVMQGGRPLPSPLGRSRAGHCAGRCPALAALEHIPPPLCALHTSQRPGRAAGQGQRRVKLWGPPASSNKKEAVCHLFPGTSRLSRRKLQALSTHSPARPPGRPPRARRWRKVGWIFAQSTKEREFIMSTEEVCQMAAVQVRALREFFASFWRWRGAVLWWEHLCWEHYVVYCFRGRSPGSLGMVPAPCLSPPGRVPSDWRERRQARAWCCFECSLQFTAGCALAWAGATGRSRRLQRSDRGRGGRARCFCSSTAQ